LYDPAPAGAEEEFAPSPVLARSCKSKAFGIHRPCRGGTCVFPFVTTGSAALHPWLLAVAPPGRTRGRTLARLGAWGYG